VYYPPYMQRWYRESVQPSYIRILQASPDAPAVDVYASGKLIASNLQYKQFTPYIPLIPGKYTILVYPTGTSVTPIINTSLDVIPQLNYTVAATGMLRDIKPLVIPDTALPLPPNRIQLKFVHLSPNTPRIDITLPDGSILFRDVEFKEITPNLLIAPGNYNFQARLTGTNQVILNVPNQLLTDNRYYTIYAVGLVNMNPPLQILSALDKASY